MFGRCKMQYICIICIYIYMYVYLDVCRFVFIHSLIYIYIYVYRIFHIYIINKVIRLFIYLFGGVFISYSTRTRRPLVLAMVLQGLSLAFSWGVESPCQALRRPFEDPCPDFEGPSQALPRPFRTPLASFAKCLPKSPGKPWLGTSAG